MIKSISKKLFIFLLLLLFIRCDLPPKMEYIPDAKRCKRILPELFLSDISFHGLYGNYDTDALIFYYNLNENKLGIKNIIRFLRKQMITHEWKIIEEQEKYLFSIRIDYPVKKLIAGIQ